MWSERHSLSGVLGGGLVLHCDLKGGKQGGAWCCTRGLWDKCVAQLVWIFHSSFVSWQIDLLSLTLAITNVCSANENAGDFKACLFFRMKQREKSTHFLHGCWSSLLPKTWRRKHGMLLFRVAGRENQTVPVAVGMDKEASHLAKSSVLTGPRDVAVAVICI